VALFILLGAFLLAFALMFIHPSAAFALFFAGLVFTAVAALVGRGFRGAEKRAARSESTGPSDE
jgi:multisubunit Na+/H+ antiporter MnhE subunit